MTAIAIVPESTINEIMENQKMILKLLQKQSKIALPEEKNRIFNKKQAVHFLREAYGLKISLDTFNRRVDTGYIKPIEGLSTKFTQKELERYAACPK